MTAQETKMEKYINLPMSNEDYQYAYYLSDKYIIERNNHTGREIAKFNDYSTFRNYYLNLNKRIILPIRLEDLYSSKKFLLSQNYIDEKFKISNLENNIDYFLQQIDSNVDKRRLSDSRYVNSLLKNLSEEIAYQSSQKFEIPILILIGEHFRSLHKNGKWIIIDDTNVIGENFLYPDLSVNNEELGLYDEIRKILYNEGDDKIFNFFKILNIYEN